MVALSPPPRLYYLSIILPEKGFINGDICISSFSKKTKSCEDVFVSFINPSFFFLFHVPPSPLGWGLGGGPEFLPTPFPPHLT